MSISAVNAVVSQEIQKPVKEAVRTEQFTNTGAAAQTAGTQSVAAGSEAHGREAFSRDRDQAAEHEEKKVRDAVNQANNKLRHTSTRCEFSYHEATKRISIKVLDKNTNELIREIPPEETLEMVEKMWELAGILVDEKR